ncbi:MAG TPA: hypothetical protein VJR27_01355 [Candidatus Saccharimonadales bacterium]|nr:hypothetical protein [Candidatus Saccharimonadales bacterium]
MSEHAGSRVFVTSKTGETSPKRDEQSRQRNERTSAGRLSFREWLLRHRRGIAAAAMLGAAATPVACTQEVGGMAQPATTSSPSVNPSSSNTGGVPFPCGHGGERGLTSTDPNVKNFTGLTVADVAGIFTTDAYDIDQCNAPRLVAPSQEMKIITSAEFQQLSTGDRLVVYVRHEQQGPQSEGVLRGLSKAANELVRTSQDGSAMYFTWGVGDSYGNRSYTGVTAPMPDHPGSPFIPSYQAVIDRPVYAGSSELYEIDLMLFNGPQNDNLARLSQDTITTVLGQWADRKVFTLPPQ